MIRSIADHRQEGRNDNGRIACNSAKRPIAVYNSDSTERRYRYAPGTNRLIALTQSSASNTGNTDGMRMQKTGLSKKPEGIDDKNAQNELVQSGWLYHATGVPLAQLDLNRMAQQISAQQTDRQANKNTSRRIVYNSAKRPIDVYGSNNQHIASYDYNGQGERIAKTVYAGSTSSTSYSLYSEQRLAAETDSEGHITAHYVYLYGKPVAKIEMQKNIEATHRLWKTITSLGGLIKPAEIDASDTQANIYAIHTDQLGTPQAVTDEQQGIVWQADTTPFGMASISYAAMIKTSSKAKAFEMNLRLPGQVYDAETGLNQNYYRDYDAQLGRYTTPDPMGIEGGMNPYSYVSNNPLTNIDPLGLYQSDIHYYMTFFLAMAAGVSYDEARIIALADQYVDNNHLTEPIDTDEKGDPEYIKSIFRNAKRLKYYHFTLSDGDTGKTLNYYNNNIITGPSSPQLNNLLDASDRAPTRCGQLQFFGEYLHAFQDTFSHRNPDNIPFDAVWTVPIMGKQLGIGHGLYGSNPDYTYNHKNGCGLAGCFNWNNNESRTLEMESEVFYKLKTKFGGDKGRSWDDVKAVMEKFNHYDEHEDDNKNFKDKFKLLNETLKDWGYEAINDDKSTREIDLFGDDKYDQGQGAKNRDKNLCDKNNVRLKQWDYAGTLLPSTDCPAVVPK